MSSPLSTNSPFLDHQADTCGWCGTELVGHVEQSPFGWMCHDTVACNSRYLAAKAAEARVEREVVSGRQYAVLLSCASQAVYGPNLVCPPIYDSRDEANAARPSRQASGLDSVLLHRDAPDEAWRDAKGRTAVEVIRARWEA